MDMATRAEFCKIVGLPESEDSTPMPHSIAVRRLWLRAADSYSTDSLKPLWVYQGHAMRRYTESIGAPRLVRAAVWRCMVEVAALRVEQNLPQKLSPPMLAAVEKTTPSWIGVQDAIEHLATAWEEIGF
jgi:hypothetical protein